MFKSFRIGIVGATGLVGQTFIKVLSDSKYRFKELRLFASSKSKGQKLSFRRKEYRVQTLHENCFNGLDLVFFSSGDSVSKKWAPLAVNQKAIVIDNSAAYRMDPNSPLVVPEVNFDQIKKPLNPKIIANPNCSTIQMAIVLNSLKKFELKELRVATYQAVSGAGQEAIKDLVSQSQNILGKKPPGKGLVFNPPIAFECQPKIGSYNEDFFCSEELKMIRETKKIFSMPQLKISAFTVRVPTYNGHGEALWITLDKDVKREVIDSVLMENPNICYLKSSLKPAQSRENRGFHTYGEITGSPKVFVSRLRKDMDFEKTWMMWLLADNLYRGAASNGFLIAERIFDKIQSS